jgi:hypothetical protein
VAVIAHHQRPRADFGPDVSVGSLLTNSGLILKPDLYWRCGRGAEECPAGQASKTSFKYHFGMWILLGMHGLGCRRVRPN